MSYIKLDLNDPNIKMKVGLLPETMEEAAYEVLLNQAHLIVGLAQVYAPVDTGSLRDSIRVERGGKGLRWREVRVRAGGYILNPNTGRFVDYAKFQEEGTRYLKGKWYLKDAFEEVTGEIPQRLKSEVISRVRSELGLDLSGLTWREPGSRGSVDFGAGLSYLDRREGWF
jgi:hypothetical protein